MNNLLTDILGYSYLKSRDFPAAQRCFSKTLQKWLKADALPAIAHCLEGIAAIAAMEGHAVHAARLFGAARIVRCQIGVPCAPLPLYERILKLSYDIARSGLGQATFEAAAQAGGSLSLEEIIAEVLVD